MTGGASIQPISGEATVTTKTDRKRKLPLVVRSGSYDAHLKGFAVDRGTGGGGTLDKRKECTQSFRDRLRGHLLEYFIHLFGWGENSALVADPVPRG
jgi:hypothetical protein